MRISYFFAGSKALYMMNGKAYQKRCIELITRLDSTLQNRTLKVEKV